MDEIGGMRFWNLYVVGALVSLGCGSSFSPMELEEQGPAHEQVGAWLDDLNRSGLHAGAVVVLREGEVWGQWFHGVERSGGDAVSGASMFRLASVSKQFTAAGILTAVAEGRLALDDDIRVWLLECPYEGTVIARR